MTAERALVQHYAAVRLRLYGPERRQPVAKKPPPPERQWNHKFGPPSPPAVSWEHIIWEVAIKHGLSVALLKGKSRRVHVVAARFEAMRRMRDEIKVQGRTPTLNWIGSKFGGRDHSSVTHAIKGRRK